MASGAVGVSRGKGVADVLTALAVGDGSVSRPYLARRSFGEGGDAARNYADIVHHLCALHGRHPGVVDLAAESGLHAPARDWIEAAVAGFARERGYLTKLVVAAGPLPSTPGQAESESAVLGQRHAIEMLARSDRSGCALGAAFALVLDWRAIRSVIDAAAARFSIDPPVILLPTNEETLAAAEAAAETVGMERAIVFGAQQILVQHRGLWDLLEARQLARRDS